MLSPDCSGLFISDGGDVGEAVGDDGGGATKDATEEAGEAQPSWIHALYTGGILRVDNKLCS